VPEDLKANMEEFPELNWSAVARDAIRKKILQLKSFQEFTKNGEFTDEDAIMLGRSLSKK
jgi:hypothetical protein